MPLLYRQHALPSRQVTDVYLLALAISHGVRPATLDTSVFFVAVRGASDEHLVVI